MAKELKEITYEISKSSTSSEDNENVDQDSRVPAVIENESKKSNEKCNGLKVTKIFGDTDKNASVRTEVILLDEAPIAPNSGTTAINKFHNNPRIIELSDNKSKMELRREFKVDVSNSEFSVDVSSRKSKNNLRDDLDDDGSADILSRLPPGTILIKQAASCSVTASGNTRTSGREDSDYVHDSSKDSTNSSESSGTVSYDAANKVRRMQYRSVRSKKIVEVRRNPVRNKKKKPIDEDFTRPRQRLLSAKRKSNFVVDNPTRKRTRAAPTPYMNTRSVTRKMYTVGATYQAPSVNDALEWKEWPSHGMHERPIWHSQVGLAYEYNERSYVSLDGETYREIIEDPVIEVVSVDPNLEGVSMSHGRRNFERLRYYSAPRSLDFMDKRESLVTGNSFQACMHGSFHSVLAYCARVVTPNYKRNVDMKIRTFPRDENPGIMATRGPEILKFQQNKMRMPQLVLPPNSVTTGNKIPENFSVNNVSNDMPKCLVIPRKTIHFTNVRNIQGNILQEVFNRSSKNTLIFLKPTDPPGKTAEKIAAALKNPSKSNSVKSKDSQETQQLQNLGKLDDSAISDEALMEMSSMYNNLLPNEETENSISKSFKTPNYPARPVTALVATKIPIKSAQDSVIDNPNCPTSRASTSAFNNPHRVSRNQDIPGSPRFTYSNQAAEIAKILAEYNQKAAKNSAVRNVTYNASNVLNVRSTTKTVKTIQQSSTASTSRNTFFSFVEQPKNMSINHRQQEIVETNQFRSSFNLNNRQVSATVTSQCDTPIRNDENQAMDLTTPKPRESKDEKKPQAKTEESRKWLQELIEDTAILYCAASGVDQDNVNEYMDTLDSVQNIQWLGS